MLKRIAAIAFIFGCASAAWFVLGGTIYTRTYDSNSRLKPGVAAIWGEPQEQRPPSAGFDRIEQQKIATETDGRKIVRTEEHRETFLLPLESSRVRVSLRLDYRQKGLLWYSTYSVDFGGEYVFRNSTAIPQAVTFRLPFPAHHAIYDSVVMEADGQSAPFSSDKLGAAVMANLAPNQTTRLRVGYHSQGLDSWKYKLGDDVSQSRDFQLTMRTNFKDVDFPPDTLSPTEKLELPRGWDLTWRYSNLISGFQIGMTMPERLQPGPLAGQISYFAPVSLLLFFFLMFIITTIRNIELHPMNYFFLATGFFAFHLLLAYLVDHISIHLAFVICSAVSVFLVVSYLRLVIGLRFAVVEAGSAQFIYLVLFSYAFFFKGLTGLSVTIGCILTLFVVMQLTGRIRWAEKFASPRAIQPRPV